MPGARGVVAAGLEDGEGAGFARPAGALRADGAVDAAGPALAGAVVRVADRDSGVPGWGRAEGAGAGGAGPREGAAAGADRAGGSALAEGAGAGARPGMAAGARVAVAAGAAPRDAGVGTRSAGGDVTFPGAACGRVGAEGAGPVEGAGARIGTEGGLGVSGTRVVAGVVAGDDAPRAALVGWPALDAGVGAAVALEVEVAPWEAAPLGVAMRGGAPGSSLN